MTVWLAVLAGMALGYVLERGDFCFHSTWRGVFGRPAEFSLARAYLVILVVTTPIVQLLIALDVLDPFVPAFAWKATVLGGLVFAAGMVVASTCITGMFYKLGHGMLGMVVALAAWAVGDIATYRGPLSGLRETLNDRPITADGDAGEIGERVATVGSLFGPAGVALLVVVAVLLVSLLLRSPEPLEVRGKLMAWLPLGLATSAVLVGGWLLADWHGFDYAFGTSGVPTQISKWLAGDDVGSMWIPLGLLSLIPGALLAAKRSGTLWVRGESGGRYLQLASGGLLMGAGAGIAGGCNLGHAMVGVPLLSLGSISATAAMIVGIGVFSRLSS